MSSTPAAKAPDKIKLGPFTIDHPFILAPMAGITNSPFRRLMRRRQSSVVISELVSANGLEYGGQKTMDLLRFHEEERVVGLQIFGERPELLVKACQHIERLGADFVDLNLGCPVPKVVSKGAGSAMCRNPSELGKILEAMVKSVKIPVTIKIRTGWDSTSRNAHEVVKAATDAGVTCVAIHGRTRAQGYSGLADWNYIAEVKSRATIPIIGNGDISTAADAVHRMKESGVDAVLIGRGALRNPFLFEQAYALWKGETFEIPATERYLELIREQRGLLEEIYDKRSAMIHARKFLAWYSAGFPGCHEFRSKVFSVTDSDAVWDAAYAFFEKSARERDLKFMSQPFLMGGHG